MRRCSKDDVFLRVISANGNFDDAEKQQRIHPPTCLSIALGYVLQLLKAHKRNQFHCKKSRIFDEIVL